MNLALSERAWKETPAAELECENPSANQLIYIDSSRMSTSIPFGLRKITDVARLYHYPPFAVQVSA